MLSKQFLQKKFKKWKENCSALVAVVIVVPLAVVPDIKFILINTVFYPHFF
jgi:hypothetical protein